MAEIPSANWYPRGWQQAEQRTGLQVLVAACLSAEETLFKVMLSPCQGKQRCHTNGLALANSNPQLSLEVESSAAV